MQTGAVLLLHLFDGTNLPAKAGELGKLLLDTLQPFMPQAVSDMSIGLISVLTAILLVQLLDLSNLSPETPDLCSQNFKMVHDRKDSLFGLSARGLPVNSVNS
jgi:hypothetical protein